MLKISVTSNSDHAIQFHLEGKLVGPWVEELRRLGEDALSQKKSLTLDLEGVRFVDMRGAALLRDFSRRQVTQLNSSQFLIRQMKEDAQ